MRPGEYQGQRLVYHGTPIHVPGGCPQDEAPCFCCIWHPDPLDPMYAEYLCLPDTDDGKTICDGLGGVWWPQTQECPTLTCEEQGCDGWAHPPYDYGRFAIEFHGFDATLNPALADDGGNMPTLLGNPNGPVTTNIGYIGLDHWSTLKGFSDPEQVTARTEMKAVRQVRLTHRPSVDVWRLQAFLLLVDQHGDSYYAQYFFSAHLKYSELAAGNLTVTLANRATTKSGNLASILANPAGSARVRLLDRLGDT